MDADTHKILNRLYRESLLQFISSDPQSLNGVKTSPLWVSSINPAYTAAARGAAHTRQQGLE